MSELYPYLLKPAYKDYIWGGSRIPRLFNRSLPDGIYAESWEVSDRSEGLSVITNGPLSGTTLGDAVLRLGHHITGSKASTAKIPLLIKIIDAAKPLSVQVHPNDNNAHLTGGEPKTEMWYILDATEDAVIYAGLKPGTTREQFSDALSSDSLKDVLQTFKPSRGDVFYIPGGRVHAIGAGCLLLEVQQNSNTTYRVYDWGRVDDQGNPRQLHVDEAMKVIDFDNTASPLCPPQTLGDTDILIDTELFKLQRFHISEERDLPLDGSTFLTLFSEAGDFSVISETGAVDCSFGQTCLIPADLKACKVIAKDATLLCASL